MSSQNIQTCRAQIGDGQIRIMHLHQRDRKLHRHTFFELVYVLKGSATHWLEGDQVSLRAGDYFIIDPGSTHCYRETKDFVIVNCLFLPEYIDRALEDCPSLSSLLSNQVLRFGVPVEIKTSDRILHDEDNRVGKLIRLMEQEYAARKTGFMELLRCYLTQVLVFAVRASEEAARTRIPHRATAAIVDYLRQHYAQPLSLDDISHRFGYTPQYLSSLFRKDMDMTIQEYLQRLRVEEACRLLDSGMTMTKLAQAVGYSDAKHFSKVFRKHKGLSPREYRSAM